MQKAGFLMTCLPLQYTEYSLNACQTVTRTVVLLIPGTVAWLGREVPWDAILKTLKFGHENISTAILPLPLIQEEQLSVNGIRIYTKYW